LLSAILKKIVKLVMEATKVAAGGYWERWNHKRENALSAA